MRIITLLFALVFVVTTTMPHAVAAPNKSKVDGFKGKAGLLKKK